MWVYYIYKYWYIPYHTYLTSHRYKHKYENISHWQVCQVWWEELGVGSPMACIMEIHRQTMYYIFLSHPNHSSHQSIKLLLSFPSSFSQIRFHFLLFSYTITFKHFLHNAPFVANYFYLDISNPSFNYFPFHLFIFSFHFAP